MVKEGWKRYKVGELGTFAKGSGISREQSDTGRIPAVRYGELYTTHNYYIREFSSHISSEVAAQALKIKYGNILFTCSGETKEEIGKCVAIVSDKDAYAGGDLIVLTPTIQMHPLFLGYALNMPSVVLQRAQLAQGDAIVHISADSIKSIEFDAPDFPEQCHIVQALSDIDDLILNLEKLVKKKKAMREGVVQSLITGCKRLPGFTGEWKEINLSKKSKIKARIGWQGLKKAEYLDSGYSFLITGTDFVNGYIDWHGCHFVTKDRYDQDTNIQVTNGDVLLTKDGTIGKVALVDGLTKPATLNSGVFVIRPINNSYSARFLYYVLSSSVFRTFLDELAAGSTIVHLYQKDLVKFDFYIPPTIEEQEAIATVIYDMEAEIIRLQAKLEKYRKIKSGMMDELLTGKVRLV